MSLYAAFCVFLILHGFSLVLFGAHARIKVMKRAWYASLFSYFYTRCNHKSANFAMSSPSCGNKTHVCFFTAEDKHQTHHSDTGHWLKRNSPKIWRTAKLTRLSTLKEWQSDDNHHVLHTLFLSCDRHFWLTALIHTFKTTRIKVFPQYGTCDSFCLWFHGLCVDFKHCFPRDLINVLTG